MVLAEIVVRSVLLSLDAFEVQSSGDSLSGTSLEEFHG
jgi:hypothetical protein